MNLSLQPSFFFYLVSSKLQTWRSQLLTHPDSGQMNSQVLDCSELIAQEPLILPCWRFEVQEYQTLNCSELVSSELLTQIHTEYVILKFQALNFLVHFLQTFHSHQNNVCIPSGYLLLECYHLVFFLRKHHVYQTFFQ